ncbi:hypothetical protein Golomagni_00535, partial [Golovinomyces magnicellulatus]
MKYSNEERQKALTKFRQYSQDTSMTYFQKFLLEFEGIEGWMEDETLDETEQLLMEMQMDHDDNETFFFTFGKIDGAKTMKILSDQSISHAFTKLKNQ